MKKVVLNTFLLGLMFVGFTACESDNLDEEILQIEEIFGTDKGDVGAPGDEQEEVDEQ